MNCDTLNEQFLDIEQCDLADAITSFSWAQYCYNAALKVGNQILSQSLIDYMD
jgi:flagellar hook-associated protein 3 FlgL